MCLTISVLTEKLSRHQTVSVDYGRVHPQPDLARIGGRLRQVCGSQNVARHVQCDLPDLTSFPHYHDNPRLYATLMKSYLWRFGLGQYPDRWEVVGFVLDSTVKKMPWTDKWHVDESTRTISIKPDQGDQHSAEAWTNAIREQLGHARSQGTFELLKGWRNEEYAVANSLGFDVRMERSGSPLFGIVTFGVHLTAYTETNEGMKIWVPRRSPTKQTYPSMLDNTVAGGIAAGEDPYECIIREAGEEASLPEDLVKSRIRRCGTVSYWHERDKRAGGEVGMMQPECQFIYDLELPADVIPKPSDDEVAGFELLNLEQVEKALRQKEFKPNCAMVMIEFLIRHGKVPQSEDQYTVDVDVVPRLHRRLRFDRTASDASQQELSFRSGRQHTAPPLSTKQGLARRGK